MKEKTKKQFRLFDIYRFHAMDTQSNIEGIVSYGCNESLTLVTVNYVDPRGIYPEGLQKTYFCHHGEKDLKEVIRLVNKRLHNCAKPGKKKGGK